MRNPIRNLTALLALSCAAVAAGGVMAADVTLIRGGFSETVALGAPAASRPGVLRGTRPLPRPGVTAEVGHMRAAAPAARIAVGGDVLWLVDAAYGGLIACTLRGSGMAGRDRIHCTSGR